MSGFGHFIHFIITILLGGLWLPIWIICALCCGSSKKRKAEDLQREQVELLREIKKQNMWRGYRD